MTEHLLRPALRAAEQILRRNINATIDGFAARDGIIYESYDGVLAAPVEMEPIPFEIILETPHQAPLDRQVEALVAALRTILAGKKGRKNGVPRSRKCRRYRPARTWPLTALALPKDRPVRLWVPDERRYGLHGFTRRVWGLPGHRPVALAQQMYQWGYVYGAVGVGFHLREGDPRLPDNVRIVTLPAYSPELNLVEGLWDQVQDTLCHRVFGTLAELELVMVVAWRGFGEDARRVRSLIFAWLLDCANASSKATIPIYYGSWCDWDPLGLSHSGKHPTPRPVSKILAPSGRFR